MNATIRKRMYTVGLAAALLLSVWGCGKDSAVTGPGTQTADGVPDSGKDDPQKTDIQVPDSTTPFVPENPDQMPTMDDDDPTPAASEDEEDLPDWYPSMFLKSQKNLGNNLRLKKVIEKAQAGEEITIATIGGSITEGAGATKYSECYAYQFYDRFARAYGKDDGSNVKFVNAGVGGTGSPFGLLRYQRDIVSRVEDADGLPDIVVIEYAVNDYQEPTNHHCYESMVRQILAQPNDPVVILLFAVFPSGFNLQRELMPIGLKYNLMTVSILDGPFTYVGDRAACKWTEKEFFYDEYHPTTLGHEVMAQCLMAAVRASAAKDTADTDINLDVKPIFGDDYVGLKTIYKTDYDESIHLNFGGFSLDDKGSYSNGPIGRVCGENFHHGTDSGNDPLSFETSCKNLLISYRAMGDASYGKIDVYVDGEKVRTIEGNTGSWGQSVQDVIFTSDTAAVHKIEIRMAAGDENKKFTITCIGYTP